MQGPGFRLPGLQGCGKEAPGRAGCLWELCERPTEHKCVCTMPQNLEVQNAPTTSQSHSTGLEAEEQEGSLLWPHTSPHGLIPPVPWPGDNLPLPCPALSFAPLAPHTRAKGTASSSHQWPLCLLPLSLGSRGGVSQVPALLEGELRQARAGREQEQSLLGCGCATAPVSALLSLVRLCPSCCSGNQAFVA